MEGGLHNGFDWAKSLPGPQHSLTHLFLPPVSRRNNSMIEEEDLYFSLYLCMTKYHHLIGSFSVSVAVNMASPLEELKVSAGDMN